VGTKPQLLRLAAVFAVFAAALFLVHGLLGAIAWASLIAIATWPLRDRLVGALGSRGETTGALLLTAAVLVFLVAPVAFVVVRGWREAPALLHLWTSSEQAGLPAPSWVGALPVAGAWVARQWNDAIGAPGALSESVRSLARDFDLSTGRALAASLAHHAMAVFFCAVILFFLYRDGTALAAQVERVVLRQLGPAGRRTLPLVVQSIRGAVNGLVLVGMGVGVLMAIAYAVAGVPHPAALGLATGLLGMVPFGAMLVLALVVLYLFAVGATTAAIALAAFGAIAIFLADHFVRPALMAGGAKLPLVLALLGVVGGLETFGVLGLFVGPTLMAMAVAVWRELTVAEPESASAA
jgi:predicted PurR-regulated permease PerM